MIDHDRDDARLREAIDAVWEQLERLAATIDEQRTAAETTDGRRADGIASGDEELDGPRSG